MLLCTLGYFVCIRICYVKEKIVTFSTHEDCCAFTKDKIRRVVLYVPCEHCFDEHHCILANRLVRGTLMGKWNDNPKQVRKWTGLASKWCRIIWIGNSLETTNQGTRMTIPSMSVQIRKYWVDTLCRSSHNFSEKLAWLDDHMKRPHTSEHSKVNK